MSPVGKLGFCRATMSIALTKKRRKKRIALKKVAIFLDKVRWSVPGAEGQ